MNPSHSKRGTALLIVLATLVLVVTASTILMSQASTIRLQRRFDRCSTIADDLMHAADRPIQDWLERKSSKVVLPPDNVVPRVLVLRDRWLNGETECEIAIAAFDQCGMVPVLGSGGGSPLRMTLPSDVLRQIQCANVSPGNAIGLDVFAPPRNGGVQRRLFPSIGKTTSTMNHLESVDDTTPPVISDLEEDRNPAFGALVATHNSTPFRINVNTAPMPLVEAALRASNCGGLEQILSGRAQGSKVTAGAPSSNRETNSSTTPTVVSASSSWAFRVDVSIGPLRRSWWAVYQPVTAQPQNLKMSSQIPSNKWECVQRLAIAE